MQKIWNVKIDGRQLSSDEIINQLLISRGIENIFDFIQPSTDNMVPFDKLINIDKAADIILKTIDNSGGFLVYYDTDCDGISAGTIMTRYLSNYTNNIKTYINEGKQHGIENFDYGNLVGVDTVIIVDSINKEPELYQGLINQGVNVIVVDHHIIPDEIIMSDVNICLVSSANNYPNSALSGSGTTWKLCMYIDWLTLNNYAEDLIDLAACGLVADMCSVGEDSLENRYLCYKGFENIKNPAIKKIKGSYEMNSQTISFGIAPLVNAANRVNDNQTVVDLFLSDDSKEVSRLVKVLKSDRELQNEEVQMLMPMLLEQGNEQLYNKCMFFFIESDISVSGLIGNKLLEIYKRPLFVLSKIQNGEYCGSMRAIGVKDFSQIVNDTGIGKCFGHELAAGAFIPVDKFDEFKEKIENILQNIEFKQETDVDIQLDIEQINEDLIKKLKMINKISGSGFKPITVLISDVKDYIVGTLSEGKHLKIETPGLTFIKWNYQADIVGSFSAIGQLDINWFGRKLTKQMIMDDLEIVG